jgi:general nucleoside transport system permease protein
MPNALMRRVARFGGGLFSSAVALSIVLAIITLILLSLEKAPLAAAERFLSGTLGSASGRTDMLMIALPMLICASGLMLTYTAGLWNIGVEGQVAVGAIFATIIARGVTSADTSPFILPAELLLAMLGGGLWALLTGLLKVFGGVNEIFGGVALNFIATNILLWLLNGDWKVGNYPQTNDFAPAALIPRLEGSRLSVVALLVAVAAYISIYAVLRGTRWGLQLRVAGKNDRSAFLLGVPTARTNLLAMFFCGALAGLAGAFLVLLMRGRLIPGISGGIGFMGILIVLLANQKAGWLPFIALFFALLPVGGLKLASSLDTSVQIDASLGNVFQSGLVLVALLTNGVALRWAEWRAKKQAREEKT